MDNPDLLALAVVGDGEAETGPLEGSWKGISFLNPRARRRRAAGPAPQRRQDRRARPCWAARTRPRSASLLEGHGYDVLEVEGDDLPGMHHRFAAALAHGLGADPRASRRRPAAATGTARRPRWPMIVLRTPKGWTGPDVVDGVQVRGTWRVAPGAAVRGQGEPGAPAAARGLAAVLPPRGAVRRRRRPDRAGPQGQPRRATCG